MSRLNKRDKQQLIRKPNKNNRTIGVYFMLTMSKSLEKTTRNTLNLLEKMASDVNLQNESTLQAVIDEAEISEQQKALIIAKNSQELAHSLQLDKLITSVIINSPDEEDDEQEEQQPDQPETNVRAFG